MTKYFSLRVVALAMLWPAVPAASADPVQISNGHFLAVPREAMSLDLFTAPAELLGSEASVTLRLFDNVSSPPAPAMGTVVQPGDAISMTRAFEGSGTVFINLPFPAGDYLLDLQTSLFRFTGGDFLVPDVLPPPPVNEEDVFFVRQPFTMVGSFTFLNLDGIATTREITGRGTAHLGLHPFRSTGASEIVSLGYSFEAAAPVPEPGTLVLCVLGGACGALLRRRR